MSKDNIKIMGYRGCKTYGSIDLNEVKLCSDPECNSCRMVENWIKEKFGDASKQEQKKPSSES